MKPKILFYDIETTPNHGYTWGKYQQNVLSFTKRRELLSVAWSWSGSSKIYCESVCTQSEKSLVKLLHELLTEADVAVAHNGDEFDHKIARARMIAHGLPPLKPIVSVDTRKAAKRFFQFEGASLSDLGDYLKLGKKLATPGFSLWERCMKGERSAFELLERYNKQDVKLLKKAYRAIGPWIENHPHLGKLSLKRGISCPTCSSRQMQSRGTYPTRRGVRRRWCCMKCGHWDNTTERTA